MRSNRKAQVTLFVIVGILLLIIIASAIFLYNFGVEEDTLTLLTMPQEQLQLQSLVESCIHRVAVPGIFLLAKNGGYIYYFEPSLNSDQIDVAIHLDRGQDTSPSADFMQQELSRFMADTLPICLYELQDSYGYNLTLGTPETEVVIAEDQIVLDIYYPVTAQIRDSKFTVDEFSADFALRLGHILRIKQEIIEMSKQSKYISLNHLASLDADVLMLPFDKETMVYSISDPSSTVGNTSLTFNFGIRYDFD